MAKKKRPEAPPKPVLFSTTPFSRLKGLVAVAPGPAAAAPPPEPAPPRQEDDGSNLFLRAMEDVKKMHRGEQARNKEATAPSGQPVRKLPGASSTADSAASEIFLEEIGRLKLEVKFDETLPDEDELKPLSGNRLRQVKRGVISVDRQLDLHGLTRDEALQELPRFLRNAQVKGCSAVLIITGKGINSSGEPVLQQAVTGWLRDAGRELVVEFSPAPREMGGSGALVAFLRPAQKPAPRNPR